MKSQTLHISPSSNAPAATEAGASAPGAPKTIYEKEAEMKKQRKAKEEAGQKAAQEKEQADTKRRNCEQSRSTLATLQNAPRVTVYDEKGERSVLDDAARQQRISEAQDAVSRYCN